MTGRHQNFTDDAIEVGQIMLDQIDKCQAKIDSLEKKPLQAAKVDEQARRVMTISGVGP